MCSKIRSVSVIVFMLFFFIFYGNSGLLAYDNPPGDSFYYIKSVQSGNINRGYWDQPGRQIRFRQGVNVAVHSKDGGRDQIFRFLNAGNGWYYIYSGNGGFLDIADGRNGNGVNVRIWSGNRSAAQKFRFRYLGNGRWKILTAWNRVLCLDNRSDRNGANVHTWDDHNGSWTEWTFVNSATGKVYVPAEKADLKLSAFVYNSSGKKQTNPGVTRIEVWYMDRSDRREPYKKKTEILTDETGKFQLPESLKKEKSLFLLSVREGLSSAYAVIYPSNGKTELPGFNAGRHDDSGHVLVDTLYRGKQYYHEENGYFYRDGGIVTRRFDFFFPEIDRINMKDSNVNKLLIALGGNSKVSGDNDIALKLQSVLQFFKKSTRSSMNAKDIEAKKAADYMFRNCRKNTSAPVVRWPSFQEMADTYSKFGFIPVGNCTANSQVAATLLYVTGLPSDRFFVSKFHYDMSWYVEHWVLAVNIGGRWHSIDPQHKNVINIKSADDFKKPLWERYISKTYDFKKPFEAWVLPGSSINAVPYVGDPDDLKKILKLADEPVFFKRNSSFSFSSGGLVFRTNGTATVKKVEGNTVTLDVKSVTQTDGPKGEITKNSRYDLVVTVKDGVYSTGTGYVHSGKVSTDGKTLSLSGEQSSITFKVN